MAEVSTIEVVVRSDGALRNANRLGRAFGEIDDNVRAARRNVETFSNRAVISFKGIAAAAASAAAAIGLFSAGRAIVDTIVEFDRLRNTINQLEGSSQAGAEAFARIREVAQLGSADIRDVAEAYRVFRSQGLEPTNEALIAAGDIASGTGKSFEQFAEALADASRGEFERFKEFGIVAKTTGEEVTLAFDGMSVTVNKNAAEIQNAVQGLIENSRFAGAFESQADTLTGAFNRIRNTFTDFAISIGEGGLKQAINDVANDFNELIKVSPELAQEIGETLGNALRGAFGLFKTLAENIDLVITAAKALAAVGLASLILNIGQSLVTAAAAARAFTMALLANPITAVATAVIGLVTALGFYIVDQAKANNAGLSFTAMWEGFKITVGDLVDKYIMPVVNVLKQVWEWLGKAAGAVLDFISLIPGAAGVLESISGAYDSLAESVAGVHSTWIENSRNVQAAMDAEAEAERSRLERQREVLEQTEEIRARERELLKERNELIQNAKNMTEEEINQAIAALQATQDKIEADRQALGIAVERNIEGGKSITITEELRLALAGQTETLKQNTDATDENTDAKERADRQRKFNDSFTLGNQFLREEIAVLRQNTNEREINLRMLRLEQDARRQGLTISKEELAERRRLLLEIDRIEEQNREKERQSARQTNDVYQEGNDILAQRSNIFSQTTSAAQSSANSIQNIFNSLLGNLIGRTSLGGTAGGNALVSIGSRLLGSIFGGSSGSSRSSGGISTGNLATVFNPSPSVFSTPVSSRSGSSIGNINLTVNNAQNMNEQSLVRAIAQGLSEEFARRGI